jgi:hypothetical protein
VGHGFFLELIFQAGTYLFNRLLPGEKQEKGRRRTALFSWIFQLWLFECDNHKIGGKDRNGIVKNASRNDTRHPGSGI